MSTQISRRKFLKLGVFSVASLAAAPHLNLEFAPAVNPADILVVVFLRGGMDALNVIPPLAGDDRKIYEQARPGIKIPLSKLISLDDNFGMHPSLSPLNDLYRDGKFAVVQATGLNVDTRSHFDAQEYMELGTPGSKSTPSGWITRYLQSASAGAAGLIPVVGIPTQPTSLLSHTQTITFNQPGDLSQWDNGYLTQQQQVLRRFYAGSNPLHLAGAHTLDVVQSVASFMEGEYKPASGVRYADDEFNRSLAAVARLIKMELGLKVATVDFHDWDMHEDQNYGVEGWLSYQLSSLASGMANFYADLQDWDAQRVVVVVMSEFGRRLAQNGSHGTDHGHGSLMMALGHGVNGGRVLGNWPGLASEQLYDRVDLAVTTDYRQVLAELLLQRMHAADLETVFPDFQIGPRLNLFASNQ